MAEPRPTRATADAVRAAPPRADDRTAERRPALDNLRVGLIAAVIVIHGVMGYTGFIDGWPYADVQEVHLPDVAVIVVFALFAPVGLFMMALLFLVAGLLTAPSVDRKGPGRFAVGRMLRLGIPFALFALLVWPGLLYGLYRPLGHTSLGYWTFFLGTLPDTGPLWFVGVLLLLSLGYAGVRGLYRRDRPASRPLTTGALLAVAAAVATASFLVRLAYPYAGTTPLDLNEWQWPECIALFAIGTAGFRRGWLDAVPAQLRRSAGQVTAVAGAALAVFLLVALALGEPQESFLGAAHWPALTVACLEGVLTVFGSIWLLSVAQHRWNRSSPLSRALGRSSFAAFVVHPVLLIALALVLRPLPAGAAVKAALVVAGGVTLSFGLGHLLVSRVRAVARVL
jgi:hypothetical protein